MRYVCLLSLVFLNGCSSLSEIERQYAGEWTWRYNSRDGSCSDTGYLSLRRDGQYSVSSEGGCEDIIASDSFGIHRYGWYASDNKICLSANEEERQLRVMTENCKEFGYVMARDKEGKHILLKQSRIIEEVDFIELARSSER